MTGHGFDLLQAAALALCLASALMVGAVFISLDRAMRERLEAGLLWVGLALLLFGLRLAAGFRADIWPAPTDALIGSLAGLAFLAGSYRLLTSGRALHAAAEDNWAEVP